MPDSLAKLEDAVRAFLKKYDELMPAVNHRFTFASLHGMEYTGDNWNDEINRLKELVNGSDA